MKNILKVFIIAAGFVLFFNANSFALVDVAAWGGFVYNSNDDDGFKGPQIGLKAHYNTSLVTLVDWGIGLYYQQSKFFYDDNSIDDLTRTSAGLDANLILSLPIIHPYLRGTWAFWDKVSTDYWSDKEKFKAFGLGGGVELTVFPFVRLFSEYMYEKSKHDDLKFTSKAINLGLKLDF